MFSYKHYYKCLYCIKKRLSASFNKNYQMLLMRTLCTKKYTLELVSEIEKELVSGSMKHRKHPGIRKMAPVKLPESITNAIYRLVSNEQESLINKESVELCKKLASRRLPIEFQDVENKIQQTALDLDELQNVPEVIKKWKFIQLKKQIQLEMGMWKPVEYDSYGSLVYLAGRAAPNYASTYRVFSEIKSRIPDFEPKTFFDFGSGVGSAVWAANSVWADTIKEYFCVDSSPDMNDISQNILKIGDTDESLIKNIHYRQFLPASANISYDLVVSAFSLLDLPSAKDRLQIIDTLWRKTSNMLVIIEYGNLAGFSSVMDARDYILHIENNSSDEISSISTGAYVVCPCPHDFTCPVFKISKSNSCGLAVSYEDILPRHRIHIKKDWVSYVVLKKGRRTYSETNWPRIVQPVLKRAKHVYCRLCCDDGNLHQIIVTKSKHGRHAYRSARSSSIGDLLPVNIKSLPTEEIDVPNEFCTEFQNDNEQNKT